MSGLMIAALLVWAYFVLKKVFGRPLSREEYEFKVRAGNAIGSAVPEAFGAQTSANLPTPDTSDRIGPAERYVSEMPRRRAERPFHPFRVRYHALHRPVDVSADDAQSLCSDIAHGELTTR